MKGFSQKFRKRDNYTCRKCGKRKEKRNFSIHSNRCLECEGKAIEYDEFPFLDEPSL